MAVTGVALLLGSRRAISVFGFTLGLLPSSVKTLEDASLLLEQRPKIVPARVLRTNGVEPVQ